MAVAASDRAFLAVSAALFAASVAGTIAMSATATPICFRGTTVLLLPADAASFLVMWVVMTAAMMLPSLVPVLWRYRRAAGTGPREPLTLLIGAGYFCVWTAVGIAVFPLATLLPRAEPPLAGAVMLAAGALQFTSWKAHHLACCRTVAGVPRDSEAAWRHGLRLGLQCSLCSIGLTAVLLVEGVMDLRAMALVTIAITAERFARVSRAIGVVLLVLGCAQV